MSLRGGINWLFIARAHVVRDQNLQIECGRRVEEVRVVCGCFNDGFKLSQRWWSTRMTQMAEESKQDILARN